MRLQTLVDAAHAAAAPACEDKSGNLIFVNDHLIALRPLIVPLAGGGCHRHP
jgi:hypothetical protein